MFRRGVPRDARSAFGGRSEVFVSLGTSNLPEARHLLSVELARFEDVLFKARGKRSPTEAATPALVEPKRDDIDRAVREVFKDRIDRVQPVDRANPQARASALLRLEQLKLFLGHISSTRGLSSNGPDQQTLWMAQDVRDRRRWKLDEHSPLWQHLLEAVTRAEVEATQKQIQLLEGLPETTIDELFSPHRYVLDVQSATVSSVPLGKLFDLYLGHRKRAAATVKSFRPKFVAFCEFIGHDDAARVTKRDVQEWVDQLVRVGGRAGRPLASKTVQETYLAAVRAVLGLAVSRGHLENNVAVGIVVPGERKVRTRKSFLDSEALLILRKTLDPGDGQLSRERVLAKRWIPWVLAYTGARVNEIAQLRGQDVAERDGVWTIEITPDAGSVKTHQSRIVVLHSHLIEQGIVDAFKGKSGPLFYDPSKVRGGSIENPQSNKVGQFLASWVRTIGVNQPYLQPNHAWRHRFKTLAREHGLQTEVVEHIQGHAPRTEGSGYGEFSISVVKREIEKLPRYDV